MFSFFNQIDINELSFVLSSINSGKICSELHLILQFFLLFYLGNAQQHKRNAERENIRLSASVVGNRPFNKQR